MTGTLGYARVCVYMHMAFSIKGKKMQLTSNNATLCSVLYKHLEGTALPENREWLFLEQQALQRTVSGGWLSI